VDDAHDGPYAREPQVDDLVHLGKALKAHGVRDVLIFGFAVIGHGGARTTKDIDLLIGEKHGLSVRRCRSSVPASADR
jgi:hypothetical protein